MLKWIERRVGAFLGLFLLLGGVPATARAPQAGRPALWEVSDADTTIYLFGTIHLLPDNFQWRTAKFDQAVAGSQQLMVETIVDDKDPTKLMSAMASLGFAKGLPPLHDRVPPARRAVLDAAVKRSGMPVQALDQMKTWAAAFILLGDQFRSLGLKSGQGVEFRSVADKMKIGRTMEAALQETADRLDTAEFQFFVITLAIQRETGGNLAETLSNLADVLRKRGQMKLKIRAMSSESKASAYIIGSLPFVVFGLVSMVNPGYMAGFFVDQRLIIAGLGGLCWMGIGVFIMAKMINFEI